MLQKLSPATVPSSPHTVTLTLFWSMTRRRTDRLSSRRLSVRVRNIKAQMATSNRVTMAILMATNFQRSFRIMVPSPVGDTPAGAGF